jgi:c-di-AMP phosphodiesterase-like protein
VPISEESAFILLVKPEHKTKYKNTDTLIKVTQNYPLKNLDFAVLQQHIANHFHNVAVNRWQDSIIIFVRKIILDNFKGAKKSLMTKDVSQINPFIVRFLKSVYQLQVSHLFEKYQTELKNYLEFLIQFANLSEDFRQKQSYLDFGLDKILVHYAHQPLIEAEV